MALSNQKIEIGPIVDFNNYQSYFDKYTADYGDKVKVIEFHITLKALEENFEHQVAQISKFLQASSLEKVAFHSPSVMTGDIFYNSDVSTEVHEKFSLMIKTLKDLSMNVSQKTFLVVHQGKKYPRDYLETLTNQEFKDLRQNILQIAKLGYNKLTNLVEDSKLIIALENSPPLFYNNIDLQYINDVFFEDFMDRLSEKNGSFVLDLSHAALAISHFKNCSQFPFLKFAKNNFNLESLKSLEEYVKLSGKFILHFHFNDSNGNVNNSEGLPIGVLDSVIDFSNIFKQISMHVDQPSGILEILNAENDYTLLKSSLEYLKNTTSNVSDNTNVSDIKEVIIGNKTINQNSDPFIIAEIGMNHNGDMSLAKQTIKAAMEAGADAVKFQIFTAHKLVTKEAKTFGDLIDQPKSQQEMYQKYEFSEQQYIELKKYCDSLKIIFFASAFDEENVDLLERIGTAAYKIASCDITHLPLLRHIALKGMPIIMSTGLSTPEDIKDAIKTITDVGNNKIILLHCVNSYPADIAKSNLSRITSLIKQFPYLVGFSDHSQGWKAPVIATALGSKVIEKHFTLSQNLPGVDHFFSMEPSQMKEMVDNVKLTKNSLGSGSLHLTSSEIETRKLARRSLIAKKDLPINSIINKDSIIIKRPGTGISPKEIDNIVGMRTKNEIKEDTIISMDMLQ